MVGTDFRGAELAGSNLSSSNAKNAIFREANLTCADLRSSTLGGADFRAADLTGANLKSSSGCNSAQFNAATTFCATTLCDGSIRNDDCTNGKDICCADDECGPGQAYQGNECCRTDLDEAAAAAEVGGGGGIFNFGTAILEAGSVVTDYEAGSDGGGVYEITGTVTAANSSIVTANSPNNCRPIGAIPNCTD